MEGERDMNITIREIESRDYLAVAAIWRDVLDIPSATDDITAQTYERMKGDDRYHTYVADVDGRVVGLVTAVEVIAIGYPNSYIKMNGLGVLPEFQRHGIGRMLMERVEKLAKERGADAIGLASGIRRTGAHEFYERIGYNKTSYWFRKRID